MIRFAIIIFMIAGCAGGIMAEARGTVTPQIEFAPLIRLDASQNRFFRDPARVIAVNFHRQKGKDFAAGCKAIDEGMETGQDWWLIGNNQSQADETFLKCRKIVTAMKSLLKRKFGSDVVHEEDEAFTDYNKEINQSFQCRRRTIILPNGARISSLPGNDPNGVVGKTGNMILTEFGTYPRGGYEHWDLLFPSVTRGGFKFIMISTPRGRNTKFYEVCQNEGGFYSIHFCDIYKSVFEDGYQLYDGKGNALPQRTREEQEAAIALFRRIYNSESKWPREYECKFTGDLSSLITWAEIERAAALGQELPFDFINVEGDKPIGDVFAHLRSEIEAAARVEAGLDIARRSHLTSLAMNLARANRPKHLRFNLLMRNCSFGYQRDVTRAAMELQRWSVGHGDATGLGMQMNEELERMYRDRWTGFTFTSTGKREIASAMKTAFADGTQTLPPLSGDTKYVGTDIYAIQKDDTGANLTLDETENPLLPESHCDVAYSLGLSRVAGAKNTRMPVSAPLLHKPAGW